MADMENIVILHLKWWKLRHFPCLVCLVRLKNESESELPAGLHSRADWSDLLRSDWSIWIRVFRENRSYKFSLKYVENHMFLLQIIHTGYIHKGGHGKNMVILHLKWWKLSLIYSIDSSKNESESELPAGLHLRADWSDLLRSDWLIWIRVFRENQSYEFSWKIRCFYYKLDTLGSFIETTTTKNT